MHIPIAFSAINFQRRLIADRGPEGRPISDQTLQNQFHTNGLQSRTTYVKSRATQRPKAECVTWSRAKMKLDSK